MKRQWSRYWKRRLTLIVVVDFISLLLGKTRSANYILLLVDSVVVVVCKIHCCGGHVDPCRDAPCRDRTPIRLKGSLSPYLQHVIFVADDKVGSGSVSLVNLCYGLFR